MDTLLLILSLVPGAIAAALLIAWHYDLRARERWAADAFGAIQRPATTPANASIRAPR